jgi:hypothetical protein
MRSGLAAVRQYAAEIAPVFEAVDDGVVEAAVEECLRGHPDRASLLGILRDSTYPEGIRRSIIAAAEDLMAFSEEEGQLLQDKLESLKGGGAAAGDLRNAGAAPSISSRWGA